MTEVKIKRKRRTKVEMEADRKKNLTGSLSITPGGTIGIQNDKKYFENIVKPVEPIKDPTEDTDIVAKVKKPPKALRDIDSRVKFLEEEIKSLRDLFFRLEDKHNPFLNGEVKDKVRRKL